MLTKEVVFTLARTKHNTDCTIGTLVVNKVKYATLEDTLRPVKIKGETRIKAGKYELKLRTEGGKHVDYAGDYPNMHKGMIWLQNVENFEYVYMHIGNTKKDTLGCILVGKAGSISTSSITESRVAYKEIYPVISSAILAGIKNGHKVYLQITDEA